MKIIIIALFALLTGCTTEEESKLVDDCYHDFYLQGHFSSDSGEILTPKSNSTISDSVFDVCILKVELYVEGQKALPIVEENDLEIYVLDGRSSLERYHIKRAECLSDPEKCGKDSVANTVIALLALGFFIYLFVGFAINLYKASISTGYNKFMSFFFCLLGGAGVPAIFIGSLLFGFKFLEGQHSLVYLLWWIFTCYSPYFVFTRLSRFVGIDLDSKS